ncbi:S-adenosyl-L-methionine-dependent methyltransferase [Mytilinidion resinicola]|uniref:S-adenosyl-L-methionine-dependent methyltransferase n=1 Tax=Mytilinidion resinicola TaxID=574789 RepID=A0A6A6Y162_9PEZI|nr:S-adenosyl-L-methionine-dependent methyltransferase [Mytilinidion resinicola]KAF2802298.1 S-adenosyl-L-methionine-dependent methyltransferase [Mytilinidion resinicola]
MADVSEDPAVPSGPQPVQIEAEEGELDTDSAFGDDAESYTTSLKSSITNYKYENGRRYHAFKDGSYFLPNDESEADRLDLFHHIMSLRCDGELHWAPIGDNPGRILDIGTGTGIWAIDMGDKYPSAEILGNDLSAIQPTLVPPNVKFEVDDAENEWVYSSKFDYIHCRYMAGSLKDWPRLMQQAYKYTKPGGWVEFQDFDMTFYSTGGEFKENSALDQWATGVKHGISKFGLVAEPGPKLEGWVKDAGFTNVHHSVLPIPVGQWPKDKKLKEIGAFDLIQFLDGCEAISLRIFTNVQGWSPEHIQVFLSDVRKDLKNTRLQAQHNFHVVYGQKPLTAE